MFVPLKWRFEHDVLIVTLTEVTDPAETRRACLTAAADSAFQPGMPLLIDGRVSTTISPRIITRPLISSLLARGLGPLCAVIVAPRARAVALDVLRPLAAQGLAIGVFTDLDSALLWARSSAVSSVGPPEVEAHPLGEVS